jgi:hypothetical protein
LRVYSIQSCTAVLAALTLSVSAYAAPALGLVTAKGTFQVDRIQVTENATVFDGSTIETANAASEIRLNNGARMLLARESKGTAFSDHLLLERGEGRLVSGASYRIETGKFNIQPTTPTSIGRVAVTSPGTIEVAALYGALSIKNMHGLLLANVPAGSTVQMNSDNPGTQSRITGKVVSRDGHYYITDEVSKTEFEVQGEGISGKVGKRVRVIGVAGSTTAAVGGAPPVIAATSVASVATAAISTTAVVTGVVVVSAAGVGLGVGLTREDSKATVSQ